MKIGTIYNRLRRKASSAEHKVLKLIESVRKTAQFTVSCCGKPETIMYGVLSGVSILYLSIWFANIGIIQSVFEAAQLTTWDKISFMFTMIGTLIRHMSLLSLVLVGLHIVLWTVVTMFWLEAVKLQHEKPKYKELLIGNIFGALAIGAVGVIAVSFLAPVITRQGISVFVSEHINGLIMLGFVCYADARLIHTTAQKLRGTGFYS